MLYRANSPERVLKFHQSGQAFSFTLLFFSIFFTVYYPGQHQFDMLFPLYTLATIGWILVMNQPLSTKQVWIYGLGIRLSLLLSFPALSDDIYRFFWDGKITLSGQSPYGILPEDILAKGIPYLDKPIFDLLNSPFYYTIYPPVSQFYYAVSSYFGDITQTAFTLKTLMLLTEGVGFYFLIRLLKNKNVPTARAGYYFLNPLVIIEGVGNLHFEVIMISFIIIALYQLYQNKMISSAFWFSISIGVKLLPMMLLPYFLFSLKGKNRLIFFMGLLFFSVIIFSPMMGVIPIHSFANSLDLYFRKFEFNASVYYLFRYIGQQISGYNLIKYLGPLLGILTVFYNFRKAKQYKDNTFSTFFKYGLYVWTFYLFLATTVHPWYLISVLFFATFNQWCYPYFWSYLIFISYANYSGAIYYESMWLIGLEYFLLLVYIIMEYNKRKVTVDGTV